MTVYVRTVAYGAAALEALASVVAQTKSADLMAMVTVIAPNNIAGIVARRQLAAGTPERPGIAGIEVTTLARLAERFAAGRLSPRRPASRAVLAASWRQALAANPGRFADIAAHPATIRALAKAHTELRDLSDTALEAVAASTEIAGELVSLHRDVCHRLETDWYDSTDLLDCATENIETIAVGLSVLYLPQNLTRAEARFVTAFAANRDLHVIAGLTGVQRGDEGVQRTLDLLGVVAGPAPTIATASHIVTASDADDEVRCVVRDVVATLSQTPAHRVAVLYSAAAPYARLLHEQLAAAKITVNGTSSRTIDERAVARAFLEVLALVEHDVPRAELFRALANAPTRDFTGARLSVARWERISRSAGVVGGEDWANRLDAYIEEQRARAEIERSAEDSQRWLVERCVADADTAAALRDFAVRLRDELNHANTITTWGELATWSRELFQTLIGIGSDLRTMPSDEQYAAGPIVSLLQTVESLDAIEPTASLQMLRDLLDVELAGSLPRVGRFGDGVFVGPLSAAIGLELDVVYLLGLSEDLYPGRLTVDALLPERARQASLGELPSARERLHNQQRDLLAAMAVAHRVVACFARGDLRRSTRRLPSRWLLPSLRELAHDKELGATEWQRGSYDGALVSAGSFAGELTSTTRLSTEQEWRTRQAVATGHLDDAVVHAGIGMIRARAGNSFTRFDGNLTTVAGLPDYATDDRPISPTALEKFSGCPHAFFVERLLGVKPIEQPEDVIQISSMDIGNLIHESLDALVRACGDDLPGFGEPWSAAQRQLMREIAVAGAREFQSRGLTGHDRLWEPERERIVADMDRLLDADDLWRAQVGARVVASEMPFGLRGVAAVEVPIPGGRVLMRGSADKVDIDASGRLFVTDLKTGSNWRFKGIKQDDPLVGGTKLQLPIYAFAARAQYGDATTPVYASYWFVRRDPGRIGIDLTPEVEQAYADTLSVLVQSIATGLFPLRAPEAPDFLWVQCDYCNPDGIGHAENRDRWERKRHDPALAQLVSLIEPEAAR